MFNAIENDAKGPTEEHGDIFSVDNDDVVTSKDV